MLRPRWALLTLLALLLVALAVAPASAEVERITPLDRQFQAAIPYDTAPRADDATCAKAPDAAGPGEVVWHFIANGATDLTLQGIHAVFATGGVREDPFHWKSTGAPPTATIGWWIRTGYDTLLGDQTWTDAPAAHLLLSHVCIGQQPTGSLRIVKVVVDGPIAIEDPIRLTVACDDDPASPYSLALGYPDALTATIDGIPAGARCSVSDERLPGLPPNFVWLDPDLGSPVTIVAGEQRTITVTSRIIDPPPSYRDLSVSTTADPAYDMAYRWQIAKFAETDRVNSPSDPTVGYAVKVSHDDGSPIDVSLTGTITVRNPNPVAFVVLIGDSFGSMPCDVPDSVVTVPASTDDGPGEQTVSYRCDLDAPDDGTNTARITWETPEFAGSATADTAVTFGAPRTEIDRCVNVIDTLAGPLGDVCVGDSDPSELTYRSVLDGTPGTCVDIPNTAGFTAGDTGSTGSATAAVKVCEGLDLTVTKTAAGTFDRTYLWTIDKGTRRSSAACPSAPMRPSTTRWMSTRPA